MALNFIEEFKKGQGGGNKGLPIGKELDNIDKYINGIQRGRVYVFGAGPKTGKTTLVDYGWLLEPFCYVQEEAKKGNHINIEWIYFSFEIERVAKEFDCACYFLHRDFNMELIKLEDGQTYLGRDYIELSPNYLRGRLLDDKGELIKVKDSVRDCLIKVYEERIVPLFGEFDNKGIQITPGYITFVKDRDNPTGLYHYLRQHAANNGTFFQSSTFGNKRNTNYIPRDPNKYTIVITDHVRKVMLERNFTLKQSVDKYSEYCCDIRDWCGYTFVHIVHTNRNIVSQDRVRYAKDILYPSSDDLKDTGNLAEDADYVFTMFNPNDDKYQLKQHFGIKIKDEHNNKLFPNMRTIHLVENRHGFFPLHFKVDMKGHIKSFKKLE